MAAQALAGGIARAEDIVVDLTNDGTSAPNPRSSSVLWTGRPKTTAIFASGIARMAATGSSQPLQGSDSSARRQVRGKYSTWTVVDKQFCIEACEGKTLTEGLRLPHLDAVPLG